MKSSNRLKQMQQRYHHLWSSSSKSAPETTKITVSSPPEAPNSSCLYSIQWCHIISSSSSSLQSMSLWSMVASIGFCGYPVATTASVLILVLVLLLLYYMLVASAVGPMTEEQTSFITHDDPSNDIDYLSKYCRLHYHCIDVVRGSSWWNHHFDR